MKDPSEKAANMSEDKKDDIMETSGNSRTI